MSSASLHSSSSTRGFQYDVFLSFQGRETGKGFTYELHSQLKSRGILAFMDDPTNQEGNFISSTLVAAIEGSKFAIIILSPNFAKSTLCLQEVTKISECMKEQNRILPVFFDLPYLMRCYEEAFIMYEQSGVYTSEMLKQWQEALISVANLPGCDLKDYKSERELVTKAVEEFQNNRSKTELITKVVEEFQNSGLVNPIENNWGDIREFEPTKEAMNKAVANPQKKKKKKKKRALFVSRVRNKIIVKGPTGSVSIIGGGRGGDGGNCYNDGFAGTGGSAEGNNISHLPNMNYERSGIHPG